MDGPVDRTDQMGPFEWKKLWTDADHNRNRGETHEDGVGSDWRHRIGVQER